ncbi:MAG: hypothetical protein ACYS8X_03400 [Planctomycetota bacterium]|jgi:hypothetical protein
MTDALPAAPVVEFEYRQCLYRSVPARNGAGPLWTRHGTVIRSGERVWASGIETLTGRVPDANVRWMLFGGGTDQAGLAKVADGGETHEREPCPMAAGRNGRVLLTANPVDCGPHQASGPGRAVVHEIDATQPDRIARTLEPQWADRLSVAGHTYRTVVADAETGEFVLLYQTAVEGADWVAFDADGGQAAAGQLAYPLGTGEPETGSIRVCYPAVHLAGRALHYCAPADIIEPDAEFLSFVTAAGKTFLYVFHKLYYTWTDDLLAKPFHGWALLADHSATAGWTSAQDIHVDAAGRVHLLWSERRCGDDVLRKEFFPDVPQRIALNYTVIERGRVLATKPVVEWREDHDDDKVSHRGRFQIAPDGRLYVIYIVQKDETTQNRIRRISADGRLGEPALLPIWPVFTRFHNASPVSGCQPSDIIDLVGTPAGDQGPAHFEIHYARLRIVG